MTNNKHKEIMERWNNSELSKRVKAIEMFAINHHFPEWHGETIPQFISSALLQQLEELERWVEGEIKTINYPEGADYLTVEALKSVLSHIREQKDIINNK